MKIVVIDGQGGKIGKTVIEQIRSRGQACTITAIGTNSLATSAMLKAGADNGATGENPVVIACRNADIIAGPIGIIAADSMLGEITPKMAEAVGSSSARKILIPVNRCFEVAGVRDMTLSQYVSEAVSMIFSD
ncbi:MAG: DUF3842 family protein [Spirochaetales bacterium]|nr:DUF3842 family protein [Spirochaetales bacterium]